MKIFELLIIIIIGASGWLGYRRGLIHQLGAIVGLVCGIIACELWGAKATEWFARIVGESFLVSEPTLREYALTVTGYLLVFCIVWIVVSLLSRLLQGLTKAIFLGPVDRFLGMAFMIFKWLVVTSLVMNLVLVFAPRLSSVFYPSSSMGFAIYDFVIVLAPRLLRVVVPDVPLPI